MHFLQQKSSFFPSSQPVEQLRELLQVAPQAGLILH